MTDAGLTIAGALAQRERLHGRSDTPELDTALLLCACVEQPRAYLYTWPERLLSAPQRDEFLALLARRERGEPIAHILGKREFWSLELKVSTASLIPRPDTECLVEQALRLVAAHSPGDILDLGTGCGAIALALASELPGWSVRGVDRVPEAVALARENALQLGLTNISFQTADWYRGLSVDTRYKLIVSNPPYIDPDDPHLRQGDVRFEPRSALVAEQQGLADLRHIIAGAGEWLTPDGALLLEHGYNQGQAVRDFLAQAGYVEVATGRDYAGQERISWGLRQHG